MGNPVEINVISAPGYEFIRWSVSINTETEVLSINIISIMFLTAHFVQYLLPSKLAIDEIYYNSAYDFSPEGWIEIFY